MKVLLAASECAPLVKVGGIADVIGSLPIALRDLGVDARVVVPYYKPLMDTISQNPAITLTEVARLSIPFADTENPTILFSTIIPNTDVPIYLIQNDTYLSNGGVYFTPDAMPSSQDELYRFAFFSRAVSDAFTYADSIFHPDIIHCNDWHTGLLPEIIKSSHRYNTAGLPKTVFTIHNLGYQGFSKTDVAEKLGIDVRSDPLFRWDAQDDNLDFVLQGIIGADYITAVSEHYAKEILTPEHGEGLHEILQAREARLVGILNGISNEIFDPLKDALIYESYTAANQKEGKLANKTRFQQEFGLALNPNKPLLAVISRLAQQKGLDLVADNLGAILQMGYQFVVLGTGDPLLEATFKDFAETHPEYAADYKPLITFSEEYARKMYASSDMFLIPSRYEPCGLTQMIAMRYGSVPVVRATGGLYDTVQPGETGYTFEHFDGTEMLTALKNAFVTYSTDKTAWETIVRNGMKQDFSWEQSARKYVALYHKALAL